MALTEVIIVIEHFIHEKFFAAGDLAAVMTNLLNDEDKQNPKATQVMSNETPVMINNVLYHKGELIGKTQRSE